MVRARRRSISFQSLVEFDGHALRLFLICKITLNNMRRYKIKASCQIVVYLIRSTMFNRYKRIRCIDKEVYYTSREL